jgi:hypothetical protein
MVEILELNQLEEIREQNLQLNYQLKTPSKKGKKRKINYCKGIKITDFTF